MNQQNPKFSFMEIGFAINPKNAEHFLNAEQGMFMLHADTVKDNHRINIYIDMDIYKDIDSGFNKPGETDNTVGVIYADVGDLTDQTTLMTLARLMLGIQNLDEEGYAFVLNKFVSGLKTSHYDFNSASALIHEAINYLLGNEVDVFMVEDRTQNREQIESVEKNEIDKKIDELEEMLSQE